MWQHHLSLAPYSHKQLCRAVAVMGGGTLSLSSDASQSMYPIVVEWERHWRWQKGVSEEKVVLDCDESEVIQTVCYNHHNFCWYEIKGR